MIGSLTKYIEESNNTSQSPYTKRWGQDTHFVARCLAGFIVNWLLAGIKEVMLNQRQELFCINYVSGMTATDAAIEAGYDAKYAATNTDKLLKNTKIEERIVALNTRLVDKTIATVKERKQYLTNFMRETIEGKYGITRSSNIQAIAELNKMEGDYAPEKHAVLGDIVIEIVHRDKS